MDQTIASGQQRRNPASSTLKMSGELDLAAAPMLQEELEALFTTGAISIFVDLLDATLGGQLHLIVTDPQILRVLNITGLTDVFSVHSSSDELNPGKEDA